MTKSEKEYFEKLVTDNNRLIERVYNKEQFNFMSKEQREGFIQGVTAGIECFAEYLGMEVKSVNLNTMD
jgi:hypothetical protein